MSNDDDFTGDDSGTNGAGKGLRAQLETALAEKKDLADRLSKFETQYRTTTVRDLFKAKNLPEKAAKFYTDEDVSEGAVGKWIEENADLFGVDATQSSQSSNDEPDENAKNAQRVTQSSFGNVHSVHESGDGAVVGDVEEMLHLMKTASREELQKLSMLPKNGSSVYSPR